MSNFGMTEAGKMLRDIENWFIDKYGKQAIQSQENLSNGKFFLDLKVLNGKDLMPRVIIGPSHKSEICGIYHFALDYVNEKVDFYYDSPGISIPEFYCNFKHYGADENGEPVFIDLNDFLRFNEIVKSWNESEKGNEIRLCHFTQNKGKERDFGLINYFGICYDFRKDNDASFEKCENKLKKCLDYFGRTEFIEVVKELYSFQYREDDWCFLK